MPILNCWDVDEPNKRIQHVDGVLTYANNAGTSPSKYDWIRGGTSGAVGQVIGGSDLAGSDAAGTLTLTSVLGQFTDTEVIDVLDSVHFDGVDNGGFKVGDTIEDQATRQLPVYAIEYNFPTDATAGEGYAYGVLTGAGAFLDEEVIDINGGVSTVAAVHTNAEDDNSALFGSATVNGDGIDVPGTSNTNDSVIIHYDGGSTIAIPEDAKISDATSGAEGFAQEVLGQIAAGSIRLVDSNTTGGAWTDGNGIDLEDVIFYDTLQTGKVFKVGDIVEGGTSGEQARVLAVIDDGDDSGKLITAGKTGVFTNGEDLDVASIKIAQVENTTTILDTGTLLNLPGGVRSLQRASQGGLYDSSRASLNIVRSSNAFYTHVWDTFDELDYLDDDFPMDGDFKDLIYTIKNNFYIPDLSFRFLEKGAFQDDTQDNIWSNIQSLGVVADIGNHGFLYDATNPTPRPDMYIELDGGLYPQFWLEGHINCNIKVKTSSDPSYITAGLYGLGQLIGDGLPAVWLCPYGRTYSHTTVAGIGQTQVASLANAADADNTTGTRQNPFTVGGAGAFTVGEEITETTGGILRVGIVTASDSGATGDVDYILKSATDFSNGGTIVGAVSAKSVTGGTSVDLVAGYDTDIRFMTISDEIQGGTVTTPGFIPGELVTQATTNATGYFMGVDSSDYMYCEKVNATAFSGNNNITGATGVYTVTSGVYEADQTDFYADLEDGSGEELYTGYLASDITGASAQTIAATYEWTKFLERKESTTLLGGPGSAVGKEGRFYRSLNETVPFAEVLAAPIGTFSGGTMTGAQGLFIDKDELVSADLQKIKLVNNAGTTRYPPNYQSLGMSGIFNGVRVEICRTAGDGSDIQRTEFKVGTVGTHNQSGDSTVEVAAQDRTISPLPSDVPNAGKLRILDPNDTGRYLTFIYTSVNRATNVFTLSATIGSVTGAQDLVQNDNVHVVFVQEESAGSSVNNTVQYVSSFWTYATARIKGRKEYRAWGQFVETGYTFGAVLPVDPTVNLP